jgi:protein gp37
MYRDQKRFGTDPREIRVTKSKTFNAPLKWAREDPGLVFTSSWTDFFLEEVDPAVRTEAWNIIRQTRENTYQILTKRPENIPDMLPIGWEDGYRNVWLGVSVENQSWADRRIPALLRVPARLKFLSIEPLLGPVDLEHVHDMEQLTYYDVLGRSRFDYDTLGYGVAAPMPNGIDWVIVGGESGPGARPMRSEWAIDIKDQCSEAGIPFFMKQFGGWPNKRAHFDAFPDELKFRDMPYWY